MTGQPATSELHDPPLPAVSEVEHRFVTANGIRIHLAEAGQGPPLMLLHGGPQHWYAWRHVIPQLAQHFRLISPDLRGFGWSDAPRQGYRIAERTADVIALIDVLGLDRVRLAGHDWGGWIGFELCFAAPQRVERLMAISIAHPWQRWTSFGNDWRLWYQAILMTPGLGTWVQRHTDFLPFLMRLGLRNARAAWAPGELEMYAKLFEQRDRARAQAKMYRAMRTPSGAKTLLRRQPLNLPILLVHGTRDFAIGSRVQRSGWPRYAPNMTLEFVDGGSHWLLNEHPQLIADRAHTFFDR